MNVNTGYEFDIVGKYWNVISHPIYLVTFTGSGASVLISVLPW